MAYTEGLSLRPREIEFLVAVTHTWLSWITWKRFQRKEKGRSRNKRQLTSNRRPDLLSVEDLSTLRGNNHGQESNNTSRVSRILRILRIVHRIDILIGVILVLSSTWRLMSSSSTAGRARLALQLLQRRT
jgi:hypothetical protein